MPRFSRVREAKRRFAVLQPSVRLLCTGLVVLAVQGACQVVQHPAKKANSVPVPQNDSTSAGKAQSVASGVARWNLLPKRLLETSYEAQKDGRRLFLIRGLRLVERPDGSLSRGDSVFDGDVTRFAELPARLGGGYWFYSVSGSQTDIWHAADWTSSLQAVVSLGFAVGQLAPGFGGVFASATASPRRAWIPWGPAPRARAHLPVASAFDGLAFGDSGRAVVLASMIGVLGTTDYGDSWQALRPPGEAVEVVLSPRGQPQVRTDAGLWEMNERGRLFRTARTGEDALFASLVASNVRSQAGSATPADVAPFRTGPLGSRPLRAALLAGIGDSPNTAVVVVGQSWGRVRLSDGAVLSSAPFAGVSPCRGISWRDSIGFVCGSEYSATEIYRVEHTQLKKVSHWSNSRTVRAIGNGALAVGGRCAHATLRLNLKAHDAALSPEALQYTCIWRSAKESWEIAHHIAAEGLRWIALTDGRLGVIELPGEQFAGAVSIVSEKSQLSKPLVLSGSQGARLLAKTGLWLQELRELEPGVMGGWVIGGQDFAGLSLSLDGQVTVRSIQQSVAESMFHAERVLQVVGAVTVRESHDYGETWKSTALPPAVLSSVSPASTVSVRGCSTLGCVYDDWGRVGWGKPLEEKSPVPAKLSPSPLGYSFWSLSCDPAPGEIDSAAMGAQERPSQSPSGASTGDESARSSGAPESSSWLSLMGRHGPIISRGSRAYDFGQVDRAGGYRAYTWGPARGSWRRTGKWAVTVQDRFSPLAPWVTAISRSPWRSAAQAAAPFGLSYGTTASWKLSVNASGAAGLLRVQQRREVLHFFLEKNRAALPLIVDKSTPWNAIRGFQKLGDNWYLASSDPEHVVVSRATPHGLQAVGKYPRVVQFPIELISNTAGDQLALWQKTTRSGWYVYPLDAVSGRVQEALNIPRSQLSRTPQACGAESSGWSVGSSVPLTDPAISESNINLSFTGGAEALRVHALGAKLVISSKGVCIESLAALGQNVPPEGYRLTSGKRISGGLALTVTEPLTERRWAFRCRP